MAHAQPLARGVKWTPWHLSMPWGRVTCQPDVTGHFPPSVDCIRWGMPEGEPTANDRRLTPDAFLARLEHAQMEGEVEIIDQNLAELDRLIFEHEHQREQTDRFLQRARDIRDMHEPSAERRQM